MSKINMHPPQTYSRLFRPWDYTPTIRSRPSEPHLPANNNADVCKSFNAVIKNEIDTVTEHASPTPACASMNSRQPLDSGHESENDCASSSSSSYSKMSSYEDSLNTTLEVDVSTPDATPPLQHTMAHPLPYGNTHFYGSMESHAKYLAHQQTHTPATTMAHMMPVLPPVPATLTPTTSPSGLYYAAAAAAGLPTVPTTSATAYALNPYGFGLMEQEYARVMAEEAHLKAVNARKQRPKKFKCPHCEVAFSNNGQLKGHIRIHTGERPFKCDVESCGKTFTRNEELTRHKRIHTGLRPYPCTACGKRFGRRDHLKKHMKTHMPQEREVGPAIFLPMYPYLYHL